MSPVAAYSSTASGKRAADALVVRHAELVKRIAFHLAGRLPPSVEVDDLIQAGMIGLLEAAAHYNSDRGASFETYAGIRIRGAMIDALRKLERVTSRFLDVLLEYAGEIPEDAYVRSAIRQQRCVFGAYPSAGASRAFSRLAGRAARWSVPEQRGNVEFFMERLVPRAHARLEAVR